MTTLELLNQRMHDLNKRREAHLDQRSAHDKEARSLAKQIDQIQKELLVEYAKPTIANGQPVATPTAATTASTQAPAAQAPAAQAPAAQAPAELPSTASEAQATIDPIVNRPRRRGH